ncbi:hypothetical protein CERZMDRAFT_91651, partial [Cercospora zeae-maydis SCOH1-5]
MSSCHTAHATPPSTIYVPNLHSQLQRRAEIKHEQTAGARIECHRVHCVARMKSTDPVEFVPTGTIGNVIRTAELSLPMSRPCTLFKNSMLVPVL